MKWTKIECQDLHALCLQGDEAAWGYLYNYILKISTILTDSKANTTRDDAQTIVVKLLNRGLEKVKNPNVFRAYVRTVIKNHFKDKWRRKVSKIANLAHTGEMNEKMDFDPPSTYPDPEAIIGGKTLFELVEAQVTKLSESCQLLLETYVAYKTNRYPGRYPDYKTMARKLGLPQGTLASRVKRCLDQLRALPKIKEWLRANTTVDSM